uniref:Uncharacterized protein n=1 Tax=Anguilla anguilla TaxID=7936 RepID=A0A0E9WKR1_ANGAN
MERICPSNVRSPLWSHMGERAWRNWCGTVSFVRTL